MNRLETIRLYILIMLCDKGTGHLGGALGMVEGLTAMVDEVGYDKEWFSKFENFDELEQLSQATFQRNKRNILILSNGHTCAGLYSVWAEKGLFDEMIDSIWVELSLEEKQKEIETKFAGVVDTNWLKINIKRLAFLSTFRELESPLDGHPSLRYLPFLVDASTGPLGQGAGTSVGYAKAQKIDNTGFSTLVSLGDGECQEGQIWEAAMIAAKLKLDNLTWVIDRNFIQIDGNTEEVGGLDNSTVFNKHSGLADKFLSFGWEVYETVHGNDLEDVKRAIQSLKGMQKRSGRPGVLINYTRVGYPYETFYSYEWHGKTPTLDEVKKAYSETSGKSFTA
jgi:transketolase N-terminal domain/subunit